VGKYSKIEFVVGLTGTFTNPYDLDQIDLSATFTPPPAQNGKSMVFMALTPPIHHRGKSGLPAGQVGAWSYTVQAIESHGNGHGPRERLRASPQPITAGFDPPRTKGT